MSPMLTSQGVVVATAMAVSAGTIILFDLLKDKYFPPHPLPQTPTLKSCLSSGKKKKNRKKRVQFAEDVKETKGNGEVYRRQHCNSNCKINSDQIQTSSSCANQILELKKMPANRVALYSGILRDRLHRMAYSYWPISHSLIDWLNCRFLLRPRKKMMKKKNRFFLSFWCNFSLFFFLEKFCKGIVNTWNQSFSFAQFPNFNFI